MHMKFYDEKKSLLDMYDIPAEDKYMKRAYMVLALFEHIDPVKVKFKKKLTDKKTEIKGRYVLKYIFKTLRIANRIEIVKDRYWLLYLFHEFTHQVIYKEYGITDHGKSFKRLERLFLRKYFDKILQSIIKQETKKKAANER